MIRDLYCSIRRFFWAVAYFSAAFLGGLLDLIVRKTISPSIKE
ncbi:MAG: hypothetical protein SGI71_02580 [Verrucomicrobiota bacterium]|nr:hypothetical protein [Verrucomicrobiota bacterium]